MGSVCSLNGSYHQPGGEPPDSSQACSRLRKETAYGFERVVSSRLMFDSSSLPCASDLLVVERNWVPELFCIAIKPLSQSTHVSRCPLLALSGHRCDR